MINPLLITHYFNDLFSVLFVSFKEQKKKIR